MGQHKAQLIPAPTAGWNTRDPLAAMDPNYAIQLDNIFPDTGYVSLRRGFSSFATLSDGGASTGPIETMAEYAAADGTRQLIAWTKHSGAPTYRVYKVTTAGAVSNITGVLTVGNARWSTTNFRTIAAGNRLIAVNGTNNALFWDGTNLTQPGTFTGIAETSLSQVITFKSRLYFLQSSSTSFWYGGVSAIAGALTQFDIGGVAHHGGKIKFIQAWSKNTIDVNSELFVIVMDTGEVLIYDGDSPDSPAWGLVGHFFLAPPLSDRAYVKIDSDLWIITTLGIFAMSQLVAAGSPPGQITVIDDAIKPTFNNAAKTYANNFGWQGAVYRKGKYAFVNVPVAENSQTDQYVINLVTGAWCRFTGMLANCWSLLNENLFFGGATNIIYQADNGTEDNGAGISVCCRQAFMGFEAPMNKKTFKRVKPIFIITVGTSLSLDVDIDFGTRANLPVVSFTGTSTPWGSAWGSPWDAGDRVSTHWFGLTGEGNFASIRYEATLKDVSLQHISNIIVYEEGALI